MSKSTKKRNKKYSGSAPKNDNLIRVHRVNAVVRNDFSQWIHDHRKIMKTVSIWTLIIGIVTFLIVQAFIAMG